MPNDDRYIFISAEICGTRVTVARRNLESDDAQDPFLFEPDYTIAGSTGFLLWPGSWVLLGLLRGGGSPGSAPGPAAHLGERIKGMRVLELGSGTGLAGLCAAAAGAHVLMTDLPSVVEGILAGNITRNSSAGQSQSVPYACTEAAAQGPWQAAVPVGMLGGSATSLPLDWSEPLQPQLAAAEARGIATSSTDMLVACDVVWLKELLIPFRDTVVGLLQQCRPSTPCLLVFLDRSKGGSACFSSREEVLELFHSRGCHTSAYHSEMVDVDGEQMRAEVLEITLGPSIHPLHVA